MNQQDRQAPVAYSPGVMDDLKALPTNQHRNLAIFLIRDLIRGRERGEELRDRSGMDLQDCRRVYFGTAEELRLRGASWRIVYQELTAPDNRRTVIHIVAIGPRAGMVVYETAAQRLGRLPTPDLSRTHGRSHAAQLRSTIAPAQGASPDGGWRQAGSPVPSRRAPDPPRRRRGR
ncbi:hypothetical protein ACFV1N_25530 [Streptosporangium canum]|uniref:hypothetical protein n=1 Tax=Streptosporangium canum TaxID=324952 RepID=UPI0036A09413